MSVSSSAIAIVGVQLSDVLRQRVDEVVATKYHPDTGKPYEQKQRVERLFFFGREIAWPDDFPEDLVRSVGLEYVCTGMSAYEGGPRNTHGHAWDQYVIGRQLTKSDEYANIHAVGLSRVTEALLEVSEKLVRAGAPEGLSPQLFLLLYQG